MLVDARHGLLEQSHRHAYLSSLLGIRHMVACVNKMDLVDWDEGRFREIERGFAELAGRLGVVEALSIPVSALLGDNVVEGSEHMPWYDGPPLLGVLERLEVASDRNFDDLRLPVQWTVRARGSERDDYRGYAGRLAGGVLEPGDEVLVLPRGERTTVARIDTPEGPAERAFPPMSVTAVLADDVDVGRGDLRLRARRRAAGHPPDRGARVLDGGDARCAPARATSSSTRRGACARPSSRSTRAWTWPPCATPRIRPSWRSTTSAACTCGSPRR